MIFASDLYEKTTFFAGNSAAFHLKSSVFQQFSNIKSTNKFIEVWKMDFFRADTFFF